MKKLSLIVIAGMLIISNLALADLNIGLVGYYPFNGNARDESGNGNNGIVHNSILSADKFGQKNRAYRFNGVNSFINIGNDSTLKMTDGVTISAFVNMATFEPIYQNIVSDHSLNEQTVGAGKILRFSYNELQFIVDGVYGLGAAVYVKHSFDSSALGSWHHIVGTYDRNVAKLFVDGQQVDNIQYYAPLVVNKNPMLIGKSGFNVDYLNGYLDEIRIYNRALSEEEIQALYDKLLGPPLLHATAVSSNRVQLSWSAIPVAKGYRIQRKTGNCSSTSPWTTYVDVSAKSTGFSLDASLTPNTAFSYQVAGYYGAQSFSLYSACASATTGKAGTPMMPGAFDLPGGQGATSQSDTQVDLVWVDESPNETEFAIFRKAGTGNWTQIDSVVANTQRYGDVTATGNTGTTSYSYDVSACNSAGCSMANPNPVVVPFSPVNLTASVASTVQLAWSDESNNESGFQIRRKNGSCAPGTPWAYMTNLAANTTAYNDSSAVSGQVYSYKVLAFRFTAGLPRSVGHSSFSKCVNATAP